MEGPKSQTSKSTTTTTQAKPQTASQKKTENASTADWGSASFFSDTSAKVKMKNYNKGLIDSIIFTVGKKRGN